MNLKEKYIVAFILPVLISGIFQVESEAQVFSDTSAMRMIRKGIDYTYNLQFREAEAEVSELSRLYPDHPVNLLFKGIIIYWENFPLLPSTPASESFEQILRRCIAKCEENKNREIQPEILLTNLSARGMLLLFYSDNDLSRKVIPLSTSTYHYIRQSFNYTSFSPDFYFFTGLYNYYREAYPEFHPIYKPVVAIFPKGNKLQGIKELDICAHKSVFLKADSYSFLQWIFANYELDIPRAIEYCRILSELYPLNPHFTVNYIKSLIMSKRYDDAEHLMNAFSDPIKYPFIKAEMKILNGLLHENKYRKYSVARDDYKEGIEGLKAFGPYGYEYSSLGYMGLSRICESEGDQQGMRKYRRKAEEMNNN